MASLWIHQFKTLAYRPSDAPIAPLDQVKGREVVTFTTHAESEAMGAETYFVRLQADADCHITATGVDPEATAEDIPLTAGQAEYFGVSPGVVISVVAAA